MPNTDHRLGYAPAASEAFGAPEGWEHQNPFPFGVPNRVRDTWNECEASGSWRPEARHVTAASAQCMTKGDLCGLEAQEGPLPETPVGVLVTAAPGCNIAGGTLRASVYTHPPLASGPENEDDDPVDPDDDAPAPQPEAGSRMRLQHAPAGGGLAAWIACQPRAVTQRLHEQSADHWAQPMYATERLKA